ncbi:hypothetical protein [Cellulomonas chengniuliangii]|uniref:DUF222 domain-containing protein n=1 Tax=Cellulomonas chengniuliangii TaxID=2968084 RepID=A0ABY5KZK4_9CELL|nr:hypothetical protein [Cellulomonas chengniuliangii]MCC2310013.1 hypothetical protein [Cellulomonas chengniuliangii]MCC2317003.1 hypothetical protein [Cellulomonas chengniuliangii]UUI74590.1 hypothetical protein NP064_12400 [Cellulomonas chengniuliangii]
MAALDRRLLGIYLNDHIAGATAGVSRIRHMADTWGDTPLGPTLRDIAAEITTEREWLIDTTERLGVPVRKAKLAALWAGEHLGRLKPNGRVVSRSPLTALVELDLMQSAVSGKHSLWRSLQEWSPELGLDPEILEELALAADRQLDELRRLAVLARQVALRG